MLPLQRQKLKGLVLKQGGELALNIAMDQSTEVVSPKNHTFQLGVMPQDQAQEIHLGFSVANKMVKAWGVTVSALREGVRTLLARNTPRPRASAAVEKPCAAFAAGDL